MGHGNGRVPASVDTIEIYPCRIVSTTFMKVGVKLEFISEEFSRDIQILTTDNNNMLAIENLFGDNRCKTTWHIRLSCILDIPKRWPLPSMTTVFSKEVIVEESRNGLLEVGDSGGG
jgi:hypothetical protein